jgi:hypothetical protein
MESEQKIAEAYTRMLEANQELYAYLRNPIRDRVEYRRVFARVKVATEEYQSLIGLYLEDKYAERVEREEKRSA